MWNVGRTALDGNKTEVILTKKKIPTILTLSIGDVIVETKPVPKYLGV